MAFFATDDGAQIHYEVIPGVVPRNTVFIHGNMASRRWWYPAEKIWREKSGGKEQGSMILVEFRGCGKSSPPRSQAEVDMRLFARDFIALIKNLRMGQVNLIGHSTGGLIAALMLAEEPETFLKAILLDPVGARGVRLDDALTDAFEAMKTNRELVAMVLGSTIRDNDATSEFFRDIVVEDAFHAVQTVGDKVLRALDGLNVEASLSKVRHFVQVLHGEHDTLLPRADSQAMAELMPHAQFMVIPGQGHCANVENPKAFVEIAHSFLF